MQLTHTASGKTYKCRATRQPKRTEHRGRTWDTRRFSINDTVVTGWQDYTWGENVYFPLNGRWYALSIDAFEWNKDHSFTAKAEVAK